MLRIANETLDWRWQDTLIAGKTRPLAVASDPDAMLIDACERQDAGETGVIDPFWAATWRAAAGLDRFLDRWSSTEVGIGARLRNRTRGSFGSISRRRCGSDRWCGRPTSFGSTEQSPDLGSLRYSSAAFRDRPLEPDVSDHPWKRRDVPASIVARTGTVPERSFRRRWCGLAQRSLPDHRQRVPRLDRRSTLEIHRAQNRDGR